jgi:hypothetical protein
MFKDAENCFDYTLSNRRMNVHEFGRMLRKAILLGGSGKAPNSSVRIA